MCAICYLTKSVVSHMLLSVALLFVFFWFVNNLSYCSYYSMVYEMQMYCMLKQALVWQPLLAE